MLENIEVKNIKQIKVQLITKQYINFWISSILLLFVKVSLIINLKLPRFFLANYLERSVFFENFWLAKLDPFYNGWIKFLFPHKIILLALQIEYLKWLKSISYTIEKLKIGNLKFFSPWTTCSVAKNSSYLVHFYTYI